MPPRPSVSLVVPFFGTLPSLRDLLERLGRVHVERGDEIIVADNAGLPAVEPTGPVRIVAAAGTHTPGYARNRGAAIAAGEWLVFIDADTDPSRDLLDRYFEPPPARDTAVLAGGIRDALDPEDTRPSLVARRAVARGHLDDRVTTERPAFPYAQSANCAVRREAFTAVDGFAEQARAGEDADLCLRLVSAGWGLERRPEALVSHRPRASLAGALHQLVRHGSGAAWCNRRHPGSFPPPSASDLARRLARSGLSSAAAAAHGEREPAAGAALEILEALAFELGRWTPNRRWTPDRRRG